MCDAKTFGCKIKTSQSCDTRIENSLELSQNGENWIDLVQWSTVVPWEKNLIVGSNIGNNNKQVCYKRCPTNMCRKENLQIMLKFKRSVNHVCFDYLTILALLDALPTLVDIRAEWTPSTKPGDQADSDHTTSTKVRGRMYALFCKTVCRTKHQEILISSFWNLWFEPHAFCANVTAVLQINFALI